MNEINNYQTSLIKLYEYRYNNREFTEFQFYSLRNVIEQKDIQWLKENIRLFEAYLSFFPDRIVSLPPNDLLKEFFSLLLNTLELTPPKKIAKGWKKYYLPGLAQSVRTGREDVLVFNELKRFFKIGLIPEFKKKAYSEFKSSQQKNIQKLKSLGFPFQKWISDNFSETKSINKMDEENLIRYELDELLTKLLGSRSHPGIISHPSRLYSRVSDFFKNGKTADNAGILPLVGILKNSAFSCDLNTEYFYRNQLEILFTRYNDVQRLPQNVKFYFWEREPAKDIFIGSTIDTCLAVSRGSFFCILEYLLDFFMNIIIIETEDGVIGLIYLFICGNENGKPVLLFDNIELSDNYKKTSIYTDLALDYLKQTALILNIEKAFLGMNYNDSVLPALKRENIYLKKYGTEYGKKVYMDTFYGYSLPEGHVDVFSVL